MDDPERLGYGNATSARVTATVEKSGGDRVSEDRTTSANHPRAVILPGEAEAVGDHEATPHDWEQAKDPNSHGKYGTGGVQAPSYSGVQPLTRPSSVDLGAPAERARRVGR